jgi:hypothetical protein
MITTQRDLDRSNEIEVRVTPEARYELWTDWPVNWKSVWVGALTAFALVLIFGLIAIAIGAHVLGAENRIVELKKWGLGALAYTVAAAFFSFTAGGWAAGKVAGILRSEPAMLNGALVWLLGVPMLAGAAALGAGNFLGAWYGGLAGSPAWATVPAAPFARPDVPLSVATAAEIEQYRADVVEFRRKLTQWNEDTPKATRNSALGAVTALLLGLLGAVLGGWMASGEPMSFTYYRTRVKSVG